MESPGDEARISLLCFFSFFFATSYEITIHASYQMPSALRLHFKYVSFSLKHCTCLLNLSQADHSGPMCPPSISNKL